MFTDEQFIALEQEELEITDEAILVMLLILGGIKTNLENELRAFYQKYGRDGVVTYAEARKWISDKNHQRRLTALNLYLSGEFISAFGSLKTELEKMLKSVVIKEAGFFEVEIDADAILEKKWGVDDATWLKRLEDDIDLWKVKIANDWKQALLRQQSLEDILATMEKRFKSIESVITTLGISESTAVGSLARQKIFGELGISKYQFFTKPDERRCEQCGALHGLIFPMSAYEVGVTASPIHPRCRCWEVPIME